MRRRPHASRAAQASPTKARITAANASAVAIGSTKARRTLMVPGGSTGRIGSATRPSA